MHKESNNETMASDESSPDNGYDENGKKINNNGGNTTDYLYDKKRKCYFSTDVKDC